MAEVTGFKRPKNKFVELSDEGYSSAFSPMGKRTEGLNFADNTNAYGLSTDINIPTIQTSITPPGANVINPITPSTVFEGAQQRTPSGMTSTNFKDSGFDAPGGYDKKNTFTNNKVGTAATSPDKALTSDEALALKYKAEADNLNATPWADYASAASAGLGALTGVASYFDNKDMNKKRMEAMDVNIGIAREEQAHRRDFRNSTKSAFA